MCPARPAAAIAILCLLAACRDDSAPSGVTDPSHRPQFIINGEPTGSGSFGSVGALLFDFDGNGITGDDALCSGSLIADTVFLTAAHCVSFLPAGAQLYVSFNPDLFQKPLRAIAAKAFFFDPGFGHDEGDLHDVAVVILPAGKTRGIAPLRLPRAGLLDDRAARNGLKDQIFLNVGYGVDATLRGMPGFTFDGVRKVSRSPFQALEPFWLWLNMNSNATDLGGDCFGDSGSPKFFLEDSTLIVATVTSGDAVCRATSKDYRLDTSTPRAFLGPFVTLP